MVESIGSWWMWASFFAVVLVMIAVDMLLLGGKTAHKVSFREAAGWSAVWVALALLFNGVLWWYLDTAAGREVANQKALEFLTGYVIEKSLAIDNIFVWLVIFGYFAIPAEYQRRVLLYGVLGAIAMRTIMVIAGAWLLSEFHWLLYVFGLLLLVTGIKMLVFAEKQTDLSQNPVLRWMCRHMKVTESFHDERFFLVRQGVRYVTPLFLVLVLVEITDAIFAVDSIPAIFAVTTDPFIVLTSNVFAILGLRAMYVLPVQGCGGPLPSAEVRPRHRSDVRRHKDAGCRLRQYPCPAIACRGRHHHWCLGCRKPDMGETEVRAFQAIAGPQGLAGC